MTADLSWIDAVALSSMVHHGAADGLPVGRPRELRDDPAARHHADAIRQGQDFVEVFADEEHAGAAIARGDEALMHRRAGAGVEPAARAVSHDDRRHSAEFAR